MAPEDSSLEWYLQFLSVQFRIKAKKLIERCFQRGAFMYPVESVRHPMLQAMYWKQSRSIEETSEKIKELRKLGAYYLADCIRHVKSNSAASRITNAIPGLSWHQWGEAIDCIWIPENKPIWDINIEINHINGYQIYGEEAKKLELDCGIYWNDFIDALHVQLRHVSSPEMIYSIKHINNEMKRRFQA